jgi:hypothetical protein
MKQETTRIIDPDSGMTHDYEGVSLSSLVPSLLSRRGSQILEIRSDNHRTMVIAFSDLGGKWAAIIADAVDGKVLKSDVPYDFVAVTRRGKPVLVIKVKLITVKPSVP